MGLACRQQSSHSDLQKVVLWNTPTSSSLAFQHSSCPASTVFPLSFLPASHLIFLNERWIMRTPLWEGSDILFKQLAFWDNIMLIIHVERHRTHWSGDNNIDKASKSIMCNPKNVPPYFPEIWNVNESTNICIIYHSLWVLIHFQKQNCSSFTISTPIYLYSLHLYLLPLFPFNPHSGF